MSKHSGIDQIKKELDMKRAEIKKDFERRIQEFEKNAEQHREKINAHKKKRDRDIARVEQSFDKTAAATLKKRLGEEHYRRLRQWLLEKRKKELQGFRNKTQPTEDEDYDRQLAKSQDTNPKSRIWTYYFDNKKKCSEEFERDTGIELETFREH
ncbi:MAG TPA: hypothetical protein VMS95_00320 [Candidatus Krumholzibacteriaceae bacterium]|jgi:predicted solute-binding protein|nr:hypothetical protein [Candidatus Krumholzibacteriaceae bacterium]